MNGCTMILVFVLANFYGESLNYDFFFYINPLYSETSGISRNQFYEETLKNSTTTLLLFFFSNLL